MVRPHPHQGFTDTGVLASQQPRSWKNGDRARGPAQTPASSGRGPTSSSCCRAVACVGSRSDLQRGHSGVHLAVGVASSLACPSPASRAATPRRASYRNLAAMSSSPARSSPTPTTAPDSRRGREGRRWRKWFSTVSSPSRRSRQESPCSRTSGWESSLHHDAAHNVRVGHDAGQRAPCSDTISAASASLLASIWHTATIESAIESALASTRSSRRSRRVVSACWASAACSHPGRASP